MDSISLATSAEPQHIDSFDGVRGLAILLVLAGHAGWFADGWVGVDLFFVLSGFLITSILRRSKDQPFYWRRFYLKRATRILPPLLLAIIVTVTFWPKPSAIGILAYLLSLGNIAGMTRFFVWPLEHLWSLSVEEHFYVLWPWAVLSLPLRKLKGLLVTIIIAVPLCRFGFTYILPRHAPNVIYYLTPFRIDGIAMGSLLALLLEESVWQRWLKRWTAVGAVAASATYVILWTALGHPQFFPFAYSALFNAVGYSLVAVTAFCVVAHARLSPHALASRLLRNRLLRELGVISYGVYVYSWMLLQFGRLYFPNLSSVSLGVIHIPVSVGVAFVLSKFYEQPIMLWGKRRAAKSDVAPALI
jgi:peptidoglycan/LPS O-acetylase OafA/YrhL